MSKLPKTLYVILTHNEKHLSTEYYESLKHYQEQDKVVIKCLCITWVLINCKLLIVSAYLQDL